MRVSLNRVGSLSKEEEVCGKRVSLGNSRVDGVEERHEIVNVDEVLFALQDTLFSKDSVTSNTINGESLACIEEILNTQRDCVSCDEEIVVEVLMARFVC